MIFCVLYNQNIVKLKINEQVDIYEGAFSKILKINRQKIAYKRLLIRTFLFWGFYYSIADFIIGHC